jgi:hypothetical protein
VGTRGSEHATDGREGRCPWAPPGRRTPPGPSRQPVGGGFVVAPRADVSRGHGRGQWIAP